MSINKISTCTAILLAGTSGAIATYGLTKVVPGSEVIVIGLGILFEAAKLVSLTIIHTKQLPRTLKAALTGVAVVLMTANIAGVSGLLSSAYLQRQLDVKAQSHHAAVINEATVTDIKNQLNAADVTLANANTALIKAKDDRDRVKAARAVIAHARQDRDALAVKLSEATTTLARSESSAIQATGEFAAVAFLAQTIGVSADAAAKIVITTLSAVPDIAAALLLWAASYQPAPVPVRAPAPPQPKPQPKRKPQPQRKPQLKVVRAAKRPIISQSQLDKMQQRFERRQAKNRAIAEAMQEKSTANAIH